MYNEFNLAIPRKYTKIDIIKTKNGFFCNLSKYKEVEPELESNEEKPDSEEIFSDLGASIAEILAISKKEECKTEDITNALKKVYESSIKAMSAIYPKPKLGPGYIYPEFTKESFVFDTLDKVLDFAERELNEEEKKC